jgi:hypothetical protein
MGNEQILLLWLEMLREMAGIAKWNVRLKCEVWLEIMMEVVGIWRGKGRQFGISCS